MRKERFDPNDITKDDMNRLADAIEEFFDVLQEVMIIPDEIKDDCEDGIDEGMKRVKKLIRKLRKGDKSVFKDEDEWNHLR